ncbi:MAG: SWIM zinc finger family protein [Candidatus Bathyarchaeota archaeon]|nr:SWIM zinc finger family protein [Candidatus Bathyarchaeota archaeon]
MPDVPLYMMLDKADRLLKSGRIERLDGGYFNVIGDHGTYTLVVRNGRVYCSCPGFQEKGVCSHSLAVMKLNQGPRGRY